MSGELHDQYVERLEEFMKAVARKTNTLPSFFDPSPEGDNAHIINKLCDYRKLAELVASGNFNQPDTIKLAKKLAEPIDFNPTQ